MPGPLREGVPATSPDRTAHDAATNVGLDVVRGLAALLVVLGHSREALQHVVPEDLLAGPAQRLLLGPTSFAQEAVAVFFVLSGYLVGGQAVRALRGRTFSSRAYLAKRLSRLWTVLLPGLLLTAAVDALGTRLYPASFSRLVGGPRGPLGWLCNAVFLQESRCASYGSNESLWSLSYELWFYLGFAAAAVAVVALARRAWRCAAAGALAFAACLGVFGTRVLVYAPAWLLGVLIAEVVGRRAAAPAARTTRWLPALAGSLGLLGAAMLASNLLTLERPVRLLLVGVGAAPLLLLLAGNPGRTDTPAMRFVARLSPVSFSVYVYHVVLVKVLVAALADQVSLTRAPATLAVYGVAALATVACLPLWRVTEHHTHEVRQLLLRLFGARPRPVV